MGSLTRTGLGGITISWDLSQQYQEEFIMHRFKRYSAALLLSLSLAATGMMTAYADETVDYSQGPGFSDGASSSGETSSNGNTVIHAGSSDDSTGPSGGSQPQKTPVEQLTFTSDEEANGMAYAHSQAYGDSIPYIAASALRVDGFWTPSFISDDTLHNLLRNTLGNIIYRAYSSTTGWSPWVMNGTGTQALTDGSAIEAMQVRIAGVISNGYDVYYQSTLSDGTVLDWAKNGETSGTMAEGKWMISFRMALIPKGTEFTYPTAHRVSAPAGTDGIQFTGTVPTYKDGSGQPYTGWAWVNNQRYYIMNDQAVTGWQYIDGYKYFFDDHGMLVSDLRNILGDASPYMLRINRQTDTLTVYAQDGANGYILPVVSFLTTTGDDTPYGTFRIPEKYRWRLMIGDVYTQYAMRLKDGYMIHSVIFNKQNPYTLDASTYNNLGIGRSHGCTRLKTGEMKWIYDTCPVGTSVEVYASPIPGPFEAPVLDATIPVDQNFDPTDPTVPEAIAAMQAAAQAVTPVTNDPEAAVPAGQEDASAGATY